MSRNTQVASPSVFLCYAREDFERIHSLYVLLKRLGLRPWLDKYDITGGELWPMATERAVRGADFFIASFSKSSVKKNGFVQREYRLALEILMERPPERNFLIPVRLDDCKLPDLRGVGIKLSDIQRVDLFHEGPLTEGHIEPILRAIEAQSDWRRPQVALLNIIEEYDGEIDDSIIETFRVRELPYTDRIIELEAQADQKTTYKLAEEALESYLSANHSEALRLGLESFYLIACHLYRAILNDNFAVCRHKPFIYPIHQYLSGMIRAAGQTERKLILANLHKWLTSKDVYQTSRDFAAFELGMSKAHEEQDALIAALDDPNELPLVRYYAAMALGMLANKDTVPRLIETYEREHSSKMKKVIAHSIIHISKGAP
jgi:hypothetical protein